MYRTVWTYMVSGTGRFPLDMLRYDRCTPLAGVDVAILENTFQGHGYNSFAVIGPVEPTIDRWKSFGWQVNDVEKRKLA